MNLARAITAQPSPTQSVDFFRIDATRQLEAQLRSELGQFMTPLPIARFMASLFRSMSGELRLLDPGAGVGALTSAAVERALLTHDPLSIQASAWEVDLPLSAYLRDTMLDCAATCRAQGIPFRSLVHIEDFILTHPLQLQLQTEGCDYTHTILNPPYKKISTASEHRKALRQAGVETSNLYTGFMFLAAQRLKPGGEMVAIVPRSFCNGPYFKPFRKAFLSMMGIDHIHIFGRRDTAFKDDDVLQENIILHAIKGEQPDTVKITTSRGGDFCLEGGECLVQDLTERDVPFTSVVRPEDPASFIHIATNALEQVVSDRMGRFTTRLEDLGVTVSTGPVVDFRLKSHLRQEPEEGAAPLLYPAHFRGGALEWPKVMRKPNAIAVEETTRKWLWRNEGHFVLTRRFTSKEEKRRIVAFVYDGRLESELIGFENHVNVFHADQTGLKPNLARGLATFLNSSLVDRYFRQFNGHTQVNATDLRSLGYPDRDALLRLGETAGQGTLTQHQIDEMIEKELGEMSDETDPIKAQQKIDEALDIVKALGLPRGQHNERSALTLLALVNLQPEGEWNELERPLKGITPIMTFCREAYGRDYAPNTRETFRRQTMHQFVEAGLAVYNPDKPDRPVNSPKACYQVSDEAFAVIEAYGSDQWEAQLSDFLENQETLAAKWAKRREMEMIPVEVEEGKEIKLTPGAHSELIRRIIEDFGPRFAPGSEVVYVGDTGEKTGYFQKSLLKALGVEVNKHGKMPDVVLYFRDRDWLLLIESVTSHGPVDAKRHNELAELFKESKAGLVYVTAFPDRQIMGRYLSEISWETEVWCADAPTHLIHFNGERFLGPYE